MLNSLTDKSRRSGRPVLNKSELIEKIAQGADISHQSAERTLNSIIENIIQTISNGESVQLIGLGSFNQGHRSARIGRNPQTGAEIQILAVTTVKFTAGKAFKDAVNQRK